MLCLLLLWSSLSFCAAEHEAGAPYKAIGAVCATPYTPTSIAGLQGTTEGAVHRLSWTAASESEGYNFEIRRSVDGVHFKAIGAVMGAGRSAHPVGYKFDDFVAPSGETHYQVAIIDAFGTETLSEAVVHFAKQKKLKGEQLNFSIFQDLKTKGEMKVIVSEQPASEITVSVADLSGNNVSRQKIRVDAQGISDSFTCNCGTGVYFVSVVAEGTMRSKPLVIQE